ncbi:MAG: cupredoxin domain-containing protein [Candidatus Thorarchaeota archaeon]
MAKMSTNKVLLIIFIGTILLSTIGIISAYAYVNRPQQKTFDMTAQRFKFTPGTLVVNQGDNVTIHIKSLDGFHGIYIDGYNIERYLPLEQPVTINFIANKAGKFTFRCAVTCGNFHPYMIGELVVQPNNLFYLSIAVAGLLAIGMIGVVFINTIQQMGSQAKKPLIKE